MDTLFLELQENIEQTTQKIDDFKPRSDPPVAECDALIKQVVAGFRRRNKVEVAMVFDSYSERLDGDGSAILSREKLFPVLKELGVAIDEKEATQIFDEVDTDRTGLDFKELLSLLQRPSRLHEWARALPLHDLLADSIPHKPGVDPLRVVSRLTSEEIHKVCEAVSRGLERLLKEETESLKMAFFVTDHRKGNDIGSKFNIDPVICGNIDDFHFGVEGRIGESPNVLFSMI
jgi:hypothetical protein